jgi:hypothetical protein
MRFLLGWDMTLIISPVLTCILYKRPMLYSNAGGKNDLVGKLQELRRLSRLRELCCVRAMENSSALCITSIHGRVCCDGKCDWMS